MNNKTLVTIIIILVILIGGYYLLRGNNSMSNMGVTPSGQTQTTNNANGADYQPNQTGTTATTSTTGTVSGSAGADITTGGQTVKSFTVTGQNFSFSPAAMTVNKGDKVRITFKNGQGTHNLVIDEYNVNTGVIGSGAEKTVEFTADKTGSFEYYCSVGNHRAMGMHGTLTVK
ncbi:MAG: Blue (Type 1) copper protein [Candidatus Nomurabacteria bacterium]|nr:Blue (Type 1) copper protein [Candidatus Nomurabacteria bacterium]